jgi:hypothetical protein
MVPPVARMTMFGFLAAAGGAALASLAANTAAVKIKKHNVRNVVITRSLNPYCGFFG